MNTEFFQALDLIQQEKGIPKAYMKEKIEAALLTAVKKDFGTADNVGVVIDEDKQEVRVFIKKTVVENVETPSLEISVDEAKKINKHYDIGDIVEMDVKTKNFGRISAQTAKQVIVQGIREAEKDMMQREYQSKQHEILSGIVRKLDNRTGAITVEIGKTQALLMKNEQVEGENYKEGDRIKVYVVDVRSGKNEPQVVISRTHPGLVKRLFELEVPEIYDGTVEIKAISREAGSRSKVAVYSKDENVDPIGACIGPKRARITNIVNELHGEKIDIIKYSDDPVAFVSASISPAESISVEQIADKSFRVIVPDDQLSLAIGRKGQNACLAARMTGFKIDIKPASQAEE